VTTAPDDPDAQHDQDTDQDHDQDAGPPTPFGEEADTTQLDPGSEPASDPDPEPGTAG